MQRLVCLRCSGLPKQPGQPCRPTAHAWPCRNGLEGLLWTQNDSLQALLARLEGILGPLPAGLRSQGRFSHRYYTRSGLLYQRALAHGAPAALATAALADALPAQGSRVWRLWPGVQAQVATGGHQTGCSCLTSHCRPACSPGVVQLAASQLPPRRDV